MWASHVNINDKALDRIRKKGKMDGFKYKIKDVILAYRMKHGVSRAEMARRLRVPTSTLQSWELGKSPRGNVFIRLLALTGESLESFDTDAANTPSPKPERELA